MVHGRVGSVPRGAMISDLDDDLVLHVFSMLDEALLALMLSLNKRFNRIASEDVLWYALLRKELGEGTCQLPFSPVIILGVNLIDVALE